MAAKKRYAPDPSEALGPLDYGKPPSVPQYNIIGASAGPVGPDPLMHMSKALASFNPALGTLMQGGWNKQSKEADQFYAEMEKGISKDAYDFGKVLKKAGASWWANPYIYRTQLANLAANTGVKDAEFLKGNQDFITQANELKRTATDYPTELVALMEEMKPSRQSENKKESAYWDMYYPQGWIKGRDDVAKGFIDQHNRDEQVEVKETFYESLRNKILSDIEGGGNFKGETRKFISDQKSTWPDSDHSYVEGILTEGVDKVFRNLAQNPDNDYNLQNALANIRKLTRDTPEGNRVPLFGRQSERLDDLGRDIDDLMLGVATKQNTIEKQATERLTSRINSLLKNLDVWKEGNQDLVSKHNLEDIDFSNGDPLDDDEVDRLAKAFSQEKEFTDNLGDNKLNIRLTLMSILQTQSDSIERAELSAIKNQTQLDEALIVQAQSALVPLTEDDNLGYSVEGAGSILDILTPNIISAVGGAGTVAEAVNTAYKLINVDNIVAALRKANPDMRNLSELYIKQALRRELNAQMEKIGISRVEQLLDIAQKVSSGKTTNVDPIELIHTLQDARNENLGTEGNKLDDDLGHALDALKKHVDVDPFYEKMGSSTDEALYSAIRLSGSDILIKKVLPTVEFKFRKPDSLVTGSEQPLIDEVQAAQIVAEEAEKDFGIITKNLLQNFIESTPAEEREGAFAATVEEQILELAKKKIAARAPRYEALYNNALHEARKTTGLIAREHLTMLSAEEQQLLRSQQQLTTNFKEQLLSIDGGVSAETLVSKQGSNSQAAQFFTGPAGYKLYKSWEANQKELDGRREQKIKDVYETTVKLKDATDINDVEAMELHQSTLNEQKQQLKNHLLYFTPLDFTKLIKDGKLKSDEDFNLNLTYNGEDIEIPLDVRLDDLSFDKNLFLSYSQFQTLALDVETFENLADAETPPELSDETKGFADLVKQLHGLDIFNPADQEAVDTLLHNQMSMLITQHPDELPSALFKTINDKILRGWLNAGPMTEMDWEFSGGKANQIGGARETTGWEQGPYPESWRAASSIYQGKSFTTHDKAWVRGVMQQNTDILNNKYSIEDGLDFDGFTKLYGAVTGGIMGSRPYFTGTDDDGRPYLDSILEAVPLEQRSTFDTGFPWNLGQIEGEESTNVRHIIPISKLPADQQAQVMAQELALASLGHETVTHMGIGIPRYHISHELLEGKIQEYLPLLQSGEKSPELAKAFNMFLKASGVDNEKFIRPSPTPPTWQRLLGEPSLTAEERYAENVFGVAPLPIPHKSKLTEPKKKTASKSDISKEQAEKMAKDITERNAFDLRERKRSIPTPAKPSPKPKTKTVPQRKPKPKPVEKVDPKLQKLQKSIGDRNAFDLKKPKKVPRRDAPQGKKSVLSKEGKAVLLQKLKNPKQRTAAERILDTLKPKPTHPEALRIIEEISKRNAFDLKKDKK